MHERDEHAAKAQVTGLLGETLDKALNSARAEAAKRAGAHAGLREGAAKISKLLAHIREDEASDEAKAYAEKYVRRAVESALNLSEQKQAEGLVFNGKVAGLEEACSIAQRYHNASVARVKQLDLAASMIEADREREETSGVREVPEAAEG